MPARHNPSAPPTMVPTLVVVLTVLGAFSWGLAILSLAVHNNLVLAASVPAPAVMHAARRDNASSFGPQQLQQTAFPGGRTCTGGQRREWRELSGGQQQSYLQAVKCLKNTPSLLTSDKNQDGSLYEDFSYVHNYNVGRIHQVAQFLPWHRAYLMLFQLALQRYCGYSDQLPYYDWSLDSQHPENAVVWSGQSFGGDGTQSTNYCVPDGIFVGVRDVVGHPGGSCLLRQFNLGQNMMSAQYTPEQIASIIDSSSNFKDFTSAVYVPHAAFHNGVGGDMANMGASPEDPIFYLHHANVDRIWYIWQQQNPSLALQYQGSLEQRSDANDASLTDPLFASTDLPGGTIFPVGMTVRDAMLANGGGWFCYTYSNSVAPRGFMASPDAHLHVQAPTKAGDMMVMPAPAAHDRVEQRKLRHPQPLSGGMLPSHPAKLARIREVESRLRAVVDYVNALDNYLSPAALAVAGKVEGWRSVGDDEAVEHWRARAEIARAAMKLKKKFTQ
ncbi:hypothetical protein HK101_011487 [Irineochytrium annulatum]|nr:hypothetical protein HK101_011487 [Irineochytrium annulatum]